MNETQFYVSVAVTPALTLLIVTIGIVLNNSRLSDLRSDMNTRFAEMNSRFHDLRSEMNARFTDSNAHMSDLRGELIARMEDLHDTLRAEMAKNHSEVLAKLAEFDGRMGRLETQHR